MDIKNFRLLALPLISISPIFMTSALAEDSAYKLSIIDTGEEWANAKGGLKTGSAYMNNLDAKLSVDADKAFGMKGGNFVLEGWWETPKSFGNKYAGALDQQSPIDAAWNKDIYRLYQAYYDQKIGDTDILFGIYDPETEFSTTKPMTLFLSKDLTWNTAFDQSGTMPKNGSIGPGNYPYTPLSLRVRQTIDSDWSIQGVISDGASENPNHQAHNSIYFSGESGVMGLGEADYTPSKYTKVMVGAWGMTSKLSTNNEFNTDGSPHSTYGQEGAYIGAATRLYSQDDKRGLDGFFTFGYSDPVSTNVVESLNGGLTYTGLLDIRPQDKIGASFNVNRASESYRKAQILAGNGVDHYETSFETTYRAKVVDWMTVQPDVQYIVDPDYNPAIKNDLIFGVHFEVGQLFNL